jgi:hypothetical protein
MIHMPAKLQAFGKGEDMSELTAEQLRKLLYENELNLQSDEKDIALMESTGVAEPILRSARNRLWVNKETNASLRSLIAEIK